MPTTRRHFSQATGAGVAASALNQAREVFGKALLSNGVTSNTGRANGTPIP